MIKPASTRFGSRAAIPAAIALFALGLSGCGNPDGQGTGTTVTNLIMFQSTRPPTPSEPIKPDDDLVCPQVTIVGGTIRAGAADNQSVRNQLTINDVARECTNAQPGGGFTLKIGVQGRVVLGPAGGPGTYSANLRMQVRRGGVVVANRVARVSATVAQGQGGAEFVHVEENIIIPGGPAQPVVEVSLDSAGAPARRR